MGQLFENYIHNKGIKTKQLLKVWNEDHGTNYKSLWHLRAGYEWDYLHQTIDKLIKAKKITSNGFSYSVANGWKRAKIEDKVFATAAKEEYGNLTDLGKKTISFLKKQNFHRSTIKSILCKSLDVEQSKNKQAYSLAGKYSELLNQMTEETFEKVKELAKKEKGIS